MRPRLALLSAIALVLGTRESSAQLSVTSVTPGLHEQNVAPTTEVVVRFDRPVAAASLPPASATFHVFGGGSGPRAGTFALEDSERVVRFTPDEPFAAGEPVHVVLTNQIRGQDSSTLRSAGFAWRFRIAARPATRTFTLIDTLSTRDLPGTSTRVYGGQACDLDEDGFADLALIHEDSADVRVLLNRADGTGLFDDFLTPTSPTGAVPSPNEAGDFDLDGNIDICTANTAGGSVSVLLGDGDGTFRPAAHYAVGSGPHGLAVLDVNGDGYMDIATANTGSNDVALLINNGDGTFAAATFFEGGGSGEYGMTAADMNNDGIFDLVVGARTSELMIVQLGNGDGTFTQAGTRSAGGSVWMVVCGDVNGDGDMDVTTSNDGSGTGSILLGDGAGNLGAPSVTGTGGGVVATDLGDLDGDGDLDWILSSFESGLWDLFTNDGSGSFTFDQRFFGASNSACAVIVDADNDGDLDLALLDEIADLVFLYKNDFAGRPFCFGDGSGLTCPCGADSAPGAEQGCLNSSGQGATVTASGSGSVLADDLVLIAAGMPASQFGIFFSGSALIQLPFGDGFRCAGGGDIVRFGVLNSGPTGSFAQPDVASRGGFAPGESRVFQAWFRDTGSTCGAFFNLSSALGVTFLP